MARLVHEADGSAACPGVLRLGDDRAVAVHRLAGASGLVLMLREITGLTPLVPLHASGEEAVAQPA